MKKLILSVMAVLTMSIANAQLVVKESAKDTVIWQPSKMSTLPKLVMFSIDSVDDYTIYYKNQKYTQITDINYFSIGDKKTTIEFFELLLNVIETNKEYNVTVGNNNINLSKSGNSVMIYKSGTYFFLNKEQTNEILSKLK